VAVWRRRLGRRSRCRWCRVTGSEGRGGRGIIAAAVRTQMNAVPTRECRPHHAHTHTHTQAEVTIVSSELSGNAALGSGT
jgi:hypothetical protein